MIKKREKGLLFSPLPSSHITQKGLGKGKSSLPKVGDNDAYV